MNRALEGIGFQSQDFDSNQAQKYMSPYLQNVLDVQKKTNKIFKDNKQAEMLMLFKQVLLVDQGAVVQQALAGEGLQRQLGEIQAVGQQKVFEQAQQQFERDREAQLAAERQGLSAAESLSGQSAQLLH